MTEIARTDIARTAAAMVSQGKGILAADESPATMNARLETAGVPPGQEQRRAYREMLVATDGQTFPAALTRRGLLPGIKVDTGAKPLAGAPEEKITEGLDGLRERLAEY